MIPVVALRWRRPFRLSGGLLGALLLEHAEQHLQDGAELRLEGNPQGADDRVGICLDRGVRGHGLSTARLLTLDDLEEKHDALVEPRVVGQKPLDLAVAQIGDVGRAGGLAPNLGCHVRYLTAAAPPANDGEGRRRGRPLSGLAQRHDDLLHRRLALGLIHHGAVD